MRQVALAFVITLAAPAVAVADASHPSHPAKEPRAEQTLDQVMQDSAPAGERTEAGAPSSDKAGAPAASASTDKAAPATSAAPSGPPATPAPTAAQPAPAQPAAPATDDNDGTAEAPAPTPLAAMPATVARGRGPYQLGALDCRVLDGAGIERILPPKLVSGEEPDLLCRILVTQPASVASQPHQLTLTVSVGDRQTYREVRAVRMSSIGRRALVFVVPADRIATDNNAPVLIHAALSAPAQPAAGQSVEFSVETED